MLVREAAARLIGRVLRAQTPQSKSTQLLCTITCSWHESPIESQGQLEKWLHPMTYLEVRGSTTLKPDMDVGDGFFHSFLQLSHRLSL